MYLTLIFEKLVRRKVMVDRQSIDEGYSDAIGIVVNDLLETDEEKVDAAYVNDLIAQI